MMSQVKKLLPKKINKITIYLMILFIIALGGITLKGTYAKFTSSYTTPDNIVGMSLSFTLNIDNIEEYEEINVSPNSYELFNIKVTNSSNSTAYYGIWYKMVNPTTKTSDITIARSVENSTATSGSISSNNSITTTIIIKNNTSNSVKVNVGVASSTTSTSAIEYLNGKSLISGTTAEVDYAYDSTNNKYIGYGTGNNSFTISSTNYSYKNSAQSVSIPHNGVYKLEAWGAQGGSYTKEGGRGAYASGSIGLKPSDSLYVYTGEQYNGTKQAFCFNGGGPGTVSTIETNTKMANGGGATDFRLVSGDWNSSPGLASRILVAAGGGGSSNWAAENGERAGGAGGGLKGIDGVEANYGSSSYANATGGTQISGGLGGGGTNTAAPPLAGVFGSGGYNSTYSGGYMYQAGGGGGYYGGGASGANSSVVGSAAGGSSYISGYTGSVGSGYKQKFKIVYSKSGTTGTLKILDKNDQVLNSATNSVLIQNIERKNNYLGKSNWTADAYFKGRIYNFKITLASGKVLMYYDFNKGTSDLSGNGYTLTLNGASRMKYGDEYALNFDGVDDYAQLPTLPSSIDFASGFTIEFEAIWETLNSYSRIMDFGNGSESNNILIYNRETTSTIRIDYYNDATKILLGADNAIRQNGYKAGCTTGTTNIECSYHYSGKKFINGTMIAGNASMPNVAGTATMTGNASSGAAKVTPVVPVPTIKQPINAGEQLEKNQITCKDNGGGCRVYKIQDTTELGVGTHQIKVIVQDDFGYTYKYTLSLTVSNKTSQSFKVVYDATNLYLYNGSGTLLTSGAVGTVKVRNIDRTINYIGKSHFSSDGYFQGYIYKVKISLKNGAIVLDYDFTKNTVKDLSGNGYDGILQNGASLKYDGKRYALFLDGVDDYLQVPTIPSTVNFASGYTMELDVIWEETNNHARVIDFGNGERSDNLLIYNEGTTTNLGFGFRNASTISQFSSENFIIKHGVQ